LRERVTRYRAHYGTGLAAARAGAIEGGVTRYRAHYGTGLAAARATTVAAAVAAAMATNGDQWRRQ